MSERKSERFEDLPREDQVLRLAAQGYTDKEMASHLGISRETVATYWKRILNRYHASSRTEALARLMDEQQQAMAERYQVLAHEISQRRRAEKIAHVANERLKVLIQSMSTGVLFESPNRVVEHANDAMKRILGAEGEDIAGEDCRQAARELAPLFKDPRFVDRVEEIVLNRRRVVAEEIEMVDGRVFDRDFVPVEHDGDLIGYLWMFREVTTRRRSLDAFRAYADLTDVLGAFGPHLASCHARRIPRLVRHALRMLAQHLGADRAFSMEIGRDGMMRPLEAWMQPSPFSTPAMQPLPVDSLKWARERIQRDGLLIVNRLDEVPEDAYEREVMMGLGAQAAIVVPVRIAHRFEGLVRLESRDPKSWDPLIAHGLLLAAQMIGHAHLRHRRRP